MNKGTFTKELQDELEARLQVFDQDADAGFVKRLKATDYIMPTVVSGLITAFFISQIL